MGNDNSNDNNNNSPVMAVHVKNMHDSFLRAMFSTLYVINKHHGDDLITFENKNNCFGNLLRSWRAFEDNLNAMLADENLSIKEKSSLMTLSIETTYSFLNLIAGYQTLNDSFSSTARKLLTPYERTDVLLTSNRQAQQIKWIIQAQKDVHHFSREPVMTELLNFKQLLRTKTDLLNSFNRNIDYANEQLPEIRFDMLKEDYLHAEKNATLLTKELSSYTYFSDDLLAFKITSESTSVRPMSSNLVYDALVYMNEIHGGKCGKTVNSFYRQWFMAHKNPESSSISPRDSTHMEDTLKNKKNQYFERLGLKPSRKNEHYNPEKLELLKNELRRAKYQINPETGTIKKDKRGNPIFEAQTAGEKARGALFDLFPEKTISKTNNELSIGFVDPEQSEFYASLHDYEAADWVQQQKKDYERKRLARQHDRNKISSTDAMAQNNTTNSSPDKLDKAIVDADLQKNLQAMNGTPQKQQIISYRFKNTGQTYGSSGAASLPSPNGSGFFNYVVLGAMDDFIQLPGKAWSIAAPKLNAGVRNFAGALTLDGPANGFNMADIAIVMVFENPALTRHIKNGKMRTLYRDSLGFTSGALTYHAEMMFRSGGFDLIKQTGRYYATVAGNNAYVTRSLLQQYGMTAAMTSASIKAAGIEGTKAAITYGTTKASAIAAAGTTHAIAAPLSATYAVMVLPQILSDKYKVNGKIDWFPVHLQYHYDENGMVSSVGLKKLSNMQKDNVLQFNDADKKILNKVCSGELKLNRCMMAPSKKTTSFMSSK